MSYHVEYDAHRQPLGIRRERDGYLIYPHYTDSAEWKEFVEWNKTQSQPLDYTSAQPEKTKEVFALPIETPAVYAEDIFVSSRDINPDPDKAFAEALEEGNKGKGVPKSLDHITRSMLRKMERQEEEIKQLKEEIKQLKKDIKRLEKA